MAYKQNFITFTIIAHVIVLLTISNGASAYCQLDHMKKYAKQACEILSNDLRRHDQTTSTVDLKFKREIPSEINKHYKINITDLHESRRHIQPSHMRFLEEDFPNDGFLVLDKFFAKLLKDRNPKFQIIPKTMQYRPSADGTLEKEIIHQHHHKKHHKNHHSSRSHNNHVEEILSVVETDNNMVRRKRNNGGDGADGAGNIPISFCCLDRCSYYDFCKL